MGSTLISSAALDMPGNIVAKVTSVDTGRDEVEDLLRAGQGRGAHHARRQPPRVEALRDALLERDELVGQEILDVINLADPAAAPLPAGPA